MLFDQKNKDVCVQILSWSSHLPFSYSCLKQISKLNLFRILVWDSKNGRRITEPDKKILSLTDLFIRNPGCQGGVIIPFLLQNFVSIPIIENLGFTSVFSLSGDVYLEKPENFNELYKYSLDYDLVPYWRDNSKIGTMIWFIKTNVLKQIFNYILENEKRYEDYHQRGLTAEKMVMDAVQYYKFTFPKDKNTRFNYRLPIEKQPEGRGLLCETLGIKHLQFEYKQRIQQNLEQDKTLIDSTYL